MNPTLTEAETAVVKDVRKAYLGASLAAQTEIHKLVLGEQTLLARFPGRSAFILIIAGGLVVLAVQHFL